MGRFHWSTYLLIFAKSKEEIQKAIGITKVKLKELGLEIAEGKTKVVNFKKDDFDFLGFTFQHWTMNKKGEPVFFVVPKEDSFYTQAPKSNQGI